MRPATFTLLGSCVSTGPYFRVRPPDLHLADYRVGVSLVSLMSPGVDLDPSDLDPLEPFDRLRVEGDVTRSAFALLSRATDFFLMDLGEETCDLLRIGDSFFTETGALRKSRFPSRFPDHEILRRDDPATTRLWMEACARFCRGPLAVIPQERIILHRVRLASECSRGMESFFDLLGMIRRLVGGAPGRLRRWPRRWASGSFRRRRLPPTSWTPRARGTHDLSGRARSLNPILDAYYRHLRELLPGAHVIDIPDRYRVADRYHRFGLHGLHYREACERLFISALRKIARDMLAGGGGQVAPGVSLPPEAR